ncbi:MAG: DUF4173 domain-containing protein [Candidatus Curtissbacteria bacterium]|nr:DUF4173 domain-containing protein [Candidatus Curtissbacteria bacterium]
MQNIALGAFVLVVFYNLLFYKIPLGLGVGFWFLILNLFFIATAKVDSRRILTGVGFSAASVLFAFLFSLRSNFLVQVVDLVLAVLFTTAAIYAYRSQKEPRFELPYFLTLPLKLVGNSIFYFGSNLKNSEFSSSKISAGKVSYIARGILISAPILAVLFILLSVGDPIFGRVAQLFFKDIGLRLLISVTIFAAFVALGIVRAEKPDDREDTQKVVSSKAYELSTIVGGIVFLFAIFIGVQFRYLFTGVGERELHNLGIQSLTYSEYVRKGFFELIAASVLASSVVLYVLRFIHKFHAKEKIWVQGLTGTLIFEIGLVLLSDFQRLNLYQATHGLTRARVFGFVFLVWLLAMLLILVWRVFVKTESQRIFIATLSVSLVTVLTINIANIDSLIANDFKPTVNSEIDYSYIASLSTDAAGSWPEIIRESEKILDEVAVTPEDIKPDENRKLTLTYLALNRLDTKIAFLISKYGSNDLYYDWTGGGNLRDFNSRKWHSFNFSQYLAFKKIEGNYEDYKKVKHLIARTSALQSSVKPEVQKDTQLDRPIEPPLVTD